MTRWQEARGPRRARTPCFRFRAPLGLTPPRRSRGLRNPPFDYMLRGVRSSLVLMYYTQVAIIPREIKSLHDNL